ncbi:MAG: alanine:cation symporter family protein [Bacteroidaceae bacterium]|jgi:AGCS family alanine or glycine:cation symporter|nr:alanine:cation symporter family protein [Bacteroidaceae bacterium]
MEFFNTLSDWLWTYIVITMLVGCALYFTWNLRAVQFTMLPLMLRNLFKPSKDGFESIGKKKISSFQAFAISLSSRVGTGNLAGVASAIFVGGPGAVFWMWVMALLGAATAFMEATLAQLFKRHGKESFYGGPAYYMKYGLKRPWMGVLFALLIIYGFGLANQLVQSNTLCDAIGEAFHIPMQYVAIGLALMTLVIIFGGIHRIARFCAMIVPFMAFGYILLALYILVANYSQIPSMLSLIVRSAFGWEQAAGGAVGIAIMQGVKRGLFSNEAGEGSAPNAAATATIPHPVQQGLLQSLGVFTDTLVICTCTAFIILLSGLYTGQDDGIILTAHAMDYHLGSFGAWFLTAAIFLFAYSTIIANYFYGETNVRYISEKPWAITLFRCLSGVVVLLGGFMTLQQTWSIVDLAMALMTITNLIAVCLLSRYAFRLLKDFKEQRKQGKEPQFSPDLFPEADLEGWR